MSASEIYAELSLPPAPDDRPYVAVMMVATIDGKILSGDRNEDVSDLGSKTDHELFHRVGAAFGAILIGGETLRATTPRWNPASPVRIVVTGSGKIPMDSEFMKQGRPLVVTTSIDPVEGLPESQIIRFAEETVDFPSLFRRLRTDWGLTRLLVAGGSEINAQVFSAGLVDEIFLTVAPKVKLGHNIPTIAGGEALPREGLRLFDLLEHHRVDNEMFLRYRRQVTTRSVCSAVS
jgi:riboflavin biosynthesis pyrimidine reductase